MKFIYKGDPLPTFTSTYTGFKNGDITTITGGPLYNLSPACIGAPGVYTITPYSLQLRYPNNYAVNYSPDYLYINPKGNGARKIKPSLDCVEALTNSPSGFSYVAHFKYENANATPVYVPVGIDNNIVTTGSYGGVPPVVFVPGGGRFDVYFSGQKLTWTVRTFDVNQKTAVASDASSTSSRCGSLYVATRPSIVAPVLQPEQPLAKSGVYPNPATTTLIINTPKDLQSEKGITIFDASGRIYPLKIIRRLSAYSMELNIEGLRSGVYMIRLKENGVYKLVRIVKM